MVLVRLGFHMFICDWTDGSDGGVVDLFAGAEAKFCLWHQMKKAQQQQHM